MQVRVNTIVVMGTGGTIAGAAGAAGDNVGYAAAQIGVEELMRAVPGLQEAAGGGRLAMEQVAQLDSKDMDFSTWKALARRCQHALADKAVRGIVITHGTDTLEETAFFLQTLLAPERPVVLVSAMRPATSPQADGPQNLRDAVALAAVPGARGVLAVAAGRVHGALDVRKEHTYRLDAFGSGDAGPLGVLEEGRFHAFRPWPHTEPLATEARERVLSAARLPRVDIVASHAAADGLIVDALLAQRAQHPSDATAAQRLRGIVVTGTGNGTLHLQLEQALVRAQQAGVDVVRCTRCAQGRVVPVAGRPFEEGGSLSPAQARIALMLRLAAAPQ